LPSAAGDPRGGSARRTRVGILSLQGDFERHGRSIETLGVEPVRVTMPADLEGISALVLPGGESTTMLRLLASTGLREPLEAFVCSRPVLGTCAGLILLGSGGEGLPAPTFGVLDVMVERNAYGRQIDSFAAEVDVPAAGGAFHGVFIRAPRIRRVGGGVEVIARRGEEPVGVRQDRVAGLCFHPELTGDLRLHRWFLAEVAGLELPAGPAAGSRGAVAGEPR
jgi:5'-phosphate synthase pdxT subunit